MQQNNLETNIIQSTTVKTIKELKKLGESRNNFDFEEQESSTLSGKGTPEEEKLKTQHTQNPQHTKLHMTKKVSLNFTKPDSTRKILLKQNSEDEANKSNAFKRSSMRYATSKPNKEKQSIEPVDLKVAMNLILQKSKTVREQLESMQLTQTQINKYLRDDKHFQFSFQSMLDKMVQKGKVGSTLNNIQKPILLQIEQFAIAHVKRCIEKQEIHTQFQEKQRVIDQMFNRYEKELLNQEQNICYF